MRVNPLKRIFLQKNIFLNVLKYAPFTHKRIDFFVPSLSRGVSRLLDRRRRLKIFKFFSLVGGGGSDPRALRRRRLEILKFFLSIGDDGLIS
jgi:hypothetical protein